MTDLSTVSIEDLHAELRRRGVYTIVSLSADDIVEHATESGIPLVTWEKANDACHDVWWNYDHGSAMEQSIDDALDILRSEYEKDEAHDDAIA